MDHKTNTTLLVSLLFFITHLTIASSKDVCNQNDKDTLLKIKKSLNNPNHLASWDPKSDCCAWNYLECGDATANRRIISLTIFSAQISGQIPPEVGDLPYLQKLVFRKITNLTGQIPSTITKLKYLRFLRLSWTNLTGPVPEFLSQLMNLDYLTFLLMSFLAPYLAPSPCYLIFRTLILVGISLQVQYQSHLDRLQEKSLTFSYHITGSPVRYLNH